MKAELDRMVAGVSDSAKKAVRFSPPLPFSPHLAGPLTTLAFEEVRSLTLFVRFLSLHARMSYFGRCRTSRPR